MIGLWVPHAVLIPHGDGITDEILFCEQHPVLFRRVNSQIKFEHILNHAYEYHDVLLLVPAIVRRHHSGPLCRQLNGSGPFWRRRLGESI